MATYSLSPLFNGWQGFNAAGQPLNLGTITVTLAGTNTPTPTYTTSTAAVANSNPIVLDNGFPPNQIWLDDAVPVKFVLKDAAGATISTDDNIASMNAGADGLRVDLANKTNVAQGVALLGYLPPGAGAVGRTQREVNAETLSAFDFMTAAQRTDVAARTLLLDVSAALNVAIAAASVLNIRIILLPAGDYRLDNTVINAGNVELVGEGGGRVLQPTVAAQTRLAWYGASNGTMVQCGYQVGTRVGANMSSLRLDGRAVAGVGLAIKDLQHATSEGLVITGTTLDALYLTNTAGADPTAHLIFTDLQISLRGGSTQTANGIRVDGVGTGADGVTLCTFVKPRIEHANGHGVVLELRGDGFTWIEPQIFRADVETGIGVFARSTAGGAGGQITSNHTWVNPLVSSGFRIDHPEGALGWQINSGNDADMNPGLEIVYGAGGGAVSLEGSYFGYQYGRPRLHNWRDTIRHDGMLLLRWDSANNIAHTRDGAWLSGGTYGSVADGAQPGGALRLTTGAISGNAIYIQDGPAFTSGFTTTTHYPSTCFSLSPLQLTAFTLRMGWFGDYTVTNGCYVEADPTVSSFWRCVGVSGGVATTVVSTLGIVIGIVQWRIECPPGTSTVNFWYRTIGNKGWALAASISTNVPTATMLVAAWIGTNAAATKQADVYDLKHVHRTEG
jgi:hypothetical protein